MKNRAGQNKRDEAIIKKFEDQRGYCSGISTLWLYAKWATWAQEPVKVLSKFNLSTKYDYAWFESTVKLIASDLGMVGGLSEELLQKVVTKKQLDDIECFISLIEYFQYIDDYLPYGQGNLHLSLEDTTKINAEAYRTPIKEYSIASLFTLKQLQDLLKETDIIKDGKLILISSHNHDTALFKHGPNYYYFNPNCVDGEVKEVSTLTPDIFS